MPAPEDRALFVAVADCGGFTAAAKKLGVPVSTLSRRIASLESELDVVLLERTTRFVRLTTLGREYADHLRPLLSTLGALETGLARRNSAAAGVIRIAVPPGLGRPFFGPAIAALRASHPAVEIVWAGVSDAHPVRDGYDIVITERRIVDDELVARRLLTTSDVCVASAKYLRQRGRPSSARELLEHDALVLDTGRAPGEWPLLRGGTVAVKAALRADNYDLLLEAARHDVGIALVPRLMVPPEPGGGLEPVLETIVGARRDIHLTYGRDARRRGVVRALIDFALEYAQRLAHLGEG